MSNEVECPVCRQYLTERDGESAIRLLQHPLGTCMGSWVEGCLEPSASSRELRADYYGKLETLLTRLARRAGNLRKACDAE